MALTMFRQIRELRRIFGGDGTNDGVSISDGLIEMRTGGGSPAQIDMYCEVNNAHKVIYQSASSC